MGLAEFLDGLDRLFPGYGAVADRIRNGVSRADQDRLRDDGQVHPLVPGATSGTVSVSVHGRHAHFDRPTGWDELTPTDLAELRAAAGPGHFAQLHRPDSKPDDIYSITFVSGDAELARGNPVRWALWSERNLGLRASTRMRRVQFGNGVGLLWHLEGAVEGWKLGRPQQHMIRVHVAEMWSVMLSGSATPQGTVRVALAAPPSDTEEAVAGFNTVIASWVWD